MREGKRMTNFSLFEHDLDQNLVCYFVTSQVE